MRFVCVDDGVPTETPALLKASCQARGIEFHPLDPRTFLFEEERRLGPGDLLFRPAVSWISQRVERFLFSPGTATFYPGDEEIYFNAAEPTLVHERAGLPVPRSIPCHTTDRDALRGFVERLGGLPVIVKVPGMSRGVGVMVARDLGSLFALVDYLASQSVAPQLMAFVDDAVHWRVVVVGESAVAAYRNTVETDDFRTYASVQSDDYLSAVPDALAEVAVASVKAVRREFGGVDLLEHPSGRIYLLEANFPCYFAQAQLVAGIDVAGQMVEFLAAKARAALDAVGGDAGAARALPGA